MSRGRFFATILAVAVVAIAVTHGDVIAAWLGRGLMGGAHSQVSQILGGM